MDEDDVADLGPEEHVRVLSHRKAEAVFRTVDSGVVIGADTIVYYQGRILGKPADADNAFAMLRLLSGKTHQVYTGLTLAETGGASLTDVVRTDVTFRELEPWEIQAYIETGGPMDKAGAYGIQERAGLFVSGIKGCYFNVVGFPLSRFIMMLKEIWHENEIAKWME